MNNKNLETALNDLIDAIQSITLGSIEWDVIHVAGHELINNWNSHNTDDIINEEQEARNWNIKF